MLLFSLMTITSCQKDDGNSRGEQQEIISDEFSEYNGNTDFNLQECFGMSNTNNNVIYNLTSLGSVGEYIDINFSGTYEDFNGNSHSITGIVHVFGDN